MEAADAPVGAEVPELEGCVLEEEADRPARGRGAHSVELSNGHASAPASASASACCSAGRGCAVLGVRRCAVGVQGGGRRIRTSLGYSTEHRTHAHILIGHTHCLSHVSHHARPRAAPHTAGRPHFLIHVHRAGALIAAARALTRTIRFTCWLASRVGYRLAARAGRRRLGLHYCRRGVSLFDFQFHLVTSTRHTVTRHNRIIILTHISVLLPLPASPSQGKCFEFGNGSRPVVRVDRSGLRVRVAGRPVSGRPSGSGSAEPVATRTAAQGDICIMYIS
jgi:hypothetical protein